MSTTTRARRGVLLRPHRVSRDKVRENPDVLYVFGDNMAGQGLAGQEAEMRGEPNTLGVPTKWRPESNPGAFFTDADWRNPVNPRVRDAIKAAFDKIEAALAEGRRVAIPADGLGTGLAQLPRRAPEIHAFISRKIANLERAYPAPKL